MADDTCNCPPGRPLGMPHEDGCPQSSAQVLVFRNPDTQRPVAVPQEVVGESERVYQAYLAKIEGKSWDLIAAEQGWPSGKACSTEVAKYLEEGRTVVGEFKRREMQALMVSRLDALLNAVWPEAMKGKVPAVMGALAVHDRMAKLLRMEEADTEDATVPTVVVPSSEYIAELKKASGEP